MKYIYIIFAFMIVLTSCGYHTEPNWDNECIYDPVEDYKSDLGFDMPLFYSELDSYNYNGAQMDGFYFIGESKGERMRNSNRKDNSPGSTFLVNDKYNILMVVKTKEKRMYDYERLKEDKYRNSAIEKELMRNLLYEYYEDYFDELNQFLYDNNIESFWDVEQMKCGRYDSLSGTPLIHPSINEYIYMNLTYELHDEERLVISNSIAEGEYSIKTNQSLNKMVENMLDSGRLKVHNVEIVIAGERADTGYNNFDYVLEYEKDGRDFANDLEDIIMKFDEVFYDEGVKDIKQSLVYYIFYKDGFQVDKKTLVVR